MSNFNNASLIVTPNAKKAGKLYSIKPTSGTGDLDVVRATTATYVGSDGLIKTALANEVRFDYTNGSCPSILVEPQRTNLILRSEEFDNATWTKINSTITANATTSPSGTMTADKLVENNTNSPHYTLQSTGSLVVGNTYFVSIYLKDAGRNRGRIRMNGAFNIDVEFNLQNGTVTLGNASSSSIQNVGNDWYRVGFSFVANATTMSTIIWISNSTTGNSGFNYTYLGDNTSGLFFWGAQLEAGANATSYIPTTTSSVTRNADIISKSGISSLIGQTEGSVFIEFNLSTVGSSIGSAIIELTPAGGVEGESNRILIWKNISNKEIAFQIRAGGTTNIFNRVFSAPANGLVKVAMGYKSGNSFVCINGSGFSQSETFAFTQTLNFIKLGAYGSQNVVINDSINSALVFKTRLDNATLQQLTTL